MTLGFCHFYKNICTVLALYIEDLVEPDHGPAAHPFNGTNSGDMVSNHD